MTQEKFKELEIMYQNAIYICVSCINVTTSSE